MVDDEESRRIVDDVVLHFSVVASVAIRRVHLSSVNIARGYLPSRRSTIIRAEEERCSVRAELDMGPFSLTQSNPIRIIWY